MNTIIPIMISLIYFKGSLYLLLRGAIVLRCAHTTSACGGQRTTCKSQLPLSITLISGVKFRKAGLAAPWLLNVIFLQKSLYKWLFKLQQFLRQLIFNGQWDIFYWEWVIYRGYIFILMFQDSMKKCSKLRRNRHCHTNWRESSEENNGVLTMTERAQVIMNMV